MLEPTIENLYYLVKNSTLKPSELATKYRKLLEINRVNSVKYLSYHTRINTQKALDITQMHDGTFTVSLIKQNGRVYNPAKDQEIRLTVRKYDDNNELMLIDGCEGIKC